MPDVSRLTGLPVASFVPADTACPAGSGTAPALPAVLVSHACYLTAQDREARVLTHSLPADALCADAVLQDACAPVPLTVDFLMQLSSARQQQGARAHGAVLGKPQFQATAMRLARRRAAARRPNTCAPAAQRLVPCA